MTIDDSKHSRIRNRIRAERCSLSQQQQLEASRSLCRNLYQDEDFLSARKIAFYRAFDGEIDPSHALDQALQQDRKCYLPVLNINQGTLLFTEYRSDTSMQVNAYGIEEPDPEAHATLTPEQLDLILLPLLAFDLHGTRLGMGKGYYDKTLANLLLNDGKLKPNSPKLLGLAHDFQRVEKLERAAWDVPLNKVITDQATYFIKL